MTYRCTCCNEIVSDFAAWLKAKVNAMVIECEANGFYVTWDRRVYRDALAYFTDRGIGTFKNWGPDRIPIIRIGSKKSQATYYLRDIALLEVADEE